MAPENASLLHPFKIQQSKDFNLYYYMMIAFSSLYMTGAWQGAQGYNSAALSAHEMRMSGILFTWRFLSTQLFYLMIPICVYVFMHHPDFAILSLKVQDAIACIDNPQIQKQMTVPIAMRYILPLGIKGCFAAVMLAAFISTHDTYLHSWGSILVQDVILPFRKKSITPKEHIKLLRMSIIFVAIFIFAFSLIFRQTEYILMFFAITGAIFAGGGGAAIIGGLYWKRGTVQAAYSAMITGASLSITGIILRQIHQSNPFENHILNYVASKNALILGFCSSVIAMSVYVIVSLFTNKKPFNLEKILHRGKYAIEEPEKLKAMKPVRGIRALIGMGSEFAFFDKIVYLSTIFWTFLMIAVFVIGTIYNMTADVKITAWAKFWKFYINFLVVLSVLVVVWMTCGGFRDLWRMFSKLKELKRDVNDNGTVIHEDND